MCIKGTGYYHKMDSNYFFIENTNKMKQNNLKGGGSHNS
jgi:hypothetical protein